MAKSEFAPFGLCVPLSLCETREWSPPAAKGSQEAAPVPCLCLVSDKCAHFQTGGRMSEWDWPLYLQLMRTDYSCWHCSLLCNLNMKVHSQLLHCSEPASLTQVWGNKGLMCLHLAALISFKAWSYEEMKSSTFVAFSRIWGTWDQLRKGSLIFCQEHKHVKESCSFCRHS